MPGVDGLAVIREARRLKADIPVIIITGFSTEASAIEAVNLGRLRLPDQAIPHPAGAVGRGAGARRSSRRPELELELARRRSRSHAKIARFTGMR